MEILNIHHLRHGLSTGAKVYSIRPSYLGYDACYSYLNTRKYASEQGIRKIGAADFETRYRFIWN